MTLTQQIITIIMVVIGTMLTRFVPFFIFPDNKPIPPYVQYLGKVLPYAVIGLLIVYCLKSVNITASPFGAPEALAVLLTAILHCLKKNMFLSIAAGTISYMILIQLVFV